MTTLVKVEAVWTPESQQKIFRAILNGFAFPGRVQDIATPLNGGRAEVGVLASLVDEQVTLADPDDLLSPTERRLLAPAAITSAGAAEYVVCDGHRAPGEAFRPNLGTIYRPEDGATLVLTSDGFPETGSRTIVTLTGPGIETEQMFGVSGLHTDWLRARNRWCDYFPTGCDLILCGTTQIVGIPRTSRLTFNEISEEER
ncbi:MAG: phosphonate C-P lyase system protein PhnH [Capsulimonadales bacterium]|nr:phosphonate C-P lyase system protein PhnH [Capsulimonadales bacterium]